MLHIFRKKITDKSVINDAITVNIKLLYKIIEIYTLLKIITIQFDLSELRINEHVTVVVVDMGYKMTYAYSIADRSKNEKRTWK